MRIAAYAFALVLSFVSAAAAGESVMINNKEAKVRSGPGTGYTVLWRPRIYTPFEVLAKYQDWYAVRDVEGDVGWLHESVVPKQPAAIVTAELVSVHETADKGSRILYQAPRNYTFKILEKKSGWYKVTDPDSEEGWIAAAGVWLGDAPAQAAAKVEKGEKKAEKKAKKSTKKKEKSSKDKKKK